MGSNTPSHSSPKGAISEASIHTPTTHACSSNHGIAVSPHAIAHTTTGVSTNGLANRDNRIAVKNVDNREHDILDSDDYYQYHGGMIATVRSLTGTAPLAYVGDSTRPDNVRTRSLAQESARELALDRDERQAVAEEVVQVASES